MSPFWKRSQECSRAFRPFFLGTNSITIRTSEGRWKKTKTALFISCLLSTRTLFSSAKMCLACSYVEAEVRASFKRLATACYLYFGRFKVSDRLPHPDHMEALQFAILPTPATYCEASKVVRQRNEAPRSSNSYTPLCRLR